jgi:hypothetical protein
METSTLEMNLKAFNERLQNLSNSGEKTRDELAQVMGELQKRGVNLKSEDAVHAIGQVQGRLDSIADEIRRVSNDRQVAMEQFVASVPGGIDGKGGVNLGLGQLPPVGLSEGALDALREAASRRTSLRLPGGGLEATAVGPGNFAPAGRPDYVPGIDLTLYEPTRVASFIPAYKTERPVVDYYRSTAGATAAAAVAAGADKPESSPTVEAVVANIVKVAHWGSVLDEVIADYPAWSDWMGSEFIAGLINEENRQLISADGTGEDMVGLLHTSGVLTYDRDATNETKLDALASAITTLRLGAAHCAPTAIVMHPTDFLDCRLAKADTAGTYLAGDPLSAQAESLWGVPVILSSQCTFGYAIVANFPLAATVYWREFPIFEVAQPSTGLAEWKSNTTLVRAEERLVLAVQRPSAIVKVTLF